MIRITKIRSPARAGSYYEADDYYADGVSPSAWVGRGAEALGLAGSVDKETFVAALRGELPNGERLGTMRNGEWQHVPGHDLTFSAPKSVSIIAQVSGDRRVIDAHEQAVRTALEYIEAEAAGTRIHTRTGGDQVKQERTGNLAIATFRHATSRAVEPQLHTHAVVLNATRTAGDKWRSLDSRDMYRISKLAGTIYQAELARRCAELGYTVERANEHGQIELAEVPQHVRERFSGRTQQAREWLIAHGYDPEDTDRQTWERAILATRETKQDFSMRELRETWRAQAQAIGFDARASLCSAMSSANNRPHPASAQIAVTRAIEQLAEREQVFSERELLRVALVQGLSHGVTLADVRAEIERQRSRGELRDRDLGGLAAFTSRTAIRTEREMLAAADSLRVGVALLDSHAAHECVAKAEWSGGHQWTEDQRQATRQLLSTDSRIVCVQGLAGTAKTTTVLSVAAAEFAAHDYTVRAIAPTASAAEILGREINAKGTTLAQHLIDAKAGRVGGNKEAWIVDEASMASTKQLRDVLRAAERTGARVVLVGDVRQLASIEAGKALAQVQDRAPTVRLEEIVRQRDQELLAGVRAAAHGDVATALNKVEHAGSIIEHEKADQRRAAAARRYLSLSAEERAQTLLLATSREARAAINDHVRAGLKRERLIDAKEVETRALEARDLTRAERKAAWSYVQGDLVRFGRDYRKVGIERDVYYRIVSTDQKTNHIVLQGGDGKQIVWRADLVGAKTAQVYREESRRIAVGDQLVWTRNDKDLDLRNGDKLVVEAVSDRMIVVSDRAGRIKTLESDNDRHRHYSYAYCQTVHAAQGQTADRVIAEMSSRSPLSTQRSVYVAISRAREEAHVVTDSKTELALRAQERTGEKTAALEQRQQTDTPGRDRPRDRGADLSF